MFLNLPRAFIRIRFVDALSNFIGLPETANTLMVILIIIKRIIAFIGVLVILSGACIAIYSFVCACQKPGRNMSSIDLIRLKFGRMIILGLEFIVAADVIETTTAPDYYSVGILAALVGIRTLLTYFMNREMMALAKIKRK